MKNFENLVATGHEKIDQVFIHLKQKKPEIGLRLESSLFQVFLVEVLSMLISYQKLGKPWIELDLQELEEA